MKGIVTHQADAPRLDLGGGVTRRVLSHSESLMAVEVGFETGAEGAPHAHPHTQCSYVLLGRFSYTVDGESAVLAPGDSIIVPGGLSHGTVCLEKGVLLDIFTPRRDDFL